MRSIINIFDKFKNENGIVIIYIAILLVVLIGMAAFAIDIGYHRVARNQLQDASDAAALAGARQLGQNYYTAQSPTTNVVEQATAIAEANFAAGKQLTSANIDSIQIGKWDSVYRSFSVPASNPHPDAVQVITKSSFSGFFSSILGQNSLRTEATACAAISGPCEEKPTIPLAISTAYFDLFTNHEACEDIQLQNTYQSCAGWTNLSTNTFHYSQVQAMLQGGVANMPMVSAGDQINIDNGTNTPTLQDLLDLFNVMKSGSPPSWQVHVVVYSGQCNPNPSNLYTVVGFATMTITDVIPTGSNKGIKGVVDCNISVQSRGGCYYAGTYGTIPGLVQ